VPPQPQYGYGAAVDWNFVPNFAVSKIPVLEYAGWRDLLPEQALAWYRSLSHLDVPQKLIIGPWYHCEWYDSNLSDALAEHVRWFDHWLKGINNGATVAPQVRYFVQGAPRGQEWQTAARWPLPREKPKTYYFGGGAPADDARHSRVAGRLTEQAPQERQASDEYLVDYTVSTSGMATRWRGQGGPRPDSHPGLAPIATTRLDAVSMAYTTQPLAADAELTGFPSINLWVSSTAADQDFFVYLEEVDAIGNSTLLSEGAIRSSNRATRKPPFDNQNLPWHAGFEQDQRGLDPGVPVKIELALYPMSNYIKKGHRLRVTINNSDAGQWDTPVIAPAPTVRIYRDRTHLSSITLPFVAASSRRLN
jgi:putative CocE/NonD family hydrolase